MITQTPFRKVFEGIASRHQMFQMFDRHGQAPMSKARLTGRLYDGEWFEIGRAEHDYMFEILPPLWTRGDMFALREFMTGAITSVFFALSIDDFVISNFNSGSEVTFPLYIFGANQRGIPVQVNVIATMLFAVTVIAMLAVIIQQKRAEKAAAMRPEEVANKPAISLPV